MNEIIEEIKLPVRLSSAEIKNLKASVSSADPHADIYLFGSRTDVTNLFAFTGDNYIYKNIKKSDLTGIRWNFFEEFGEQKMDIVTDDGSVQTPFVEMVFPKAVQL